MTHDLANARLETPSGLKLKRANGYPKFNVTGEGRATGDDQWIVYGRDIFDLIDEIMPPPLVIGENVLIPPRMAMLGTSFMVPMSMEFKPLNDERPADPFNADPEAPANTYEDYYVLDMKYETRKESDEEDDRDDNDPNTFLEASVDAAGEFLAIPPTNMKKKDDGGNPWSYGDEAAAAALPAMKHQQAPFTKIIPNVGITLSWKFVPRPHWENIFDALGTVNDTAGEEFLLRAPRHHVLFMGVSGKQEFLYRGGTISVKPWSLDFKFIRRTIKDQGNQYGWQHVYDPDTQKWVRALRPGNKALYDDSDFRELFRQRPLAEG